MKQVLQSTLLSLLLILPAAADTTLGPVEMNSVDELAYAISSYFPKVHGEVTAVQGDRLTLSLGEKNGILSGMVLSVWRDGKNILHPVTGAVIGREEDAVGTIEVVDVKETSSTAVMKKKTTEPKAGDRARITPKKINLGILPLRSDKPEILQGLAERLGETGRFTVLGSDKVSSFLKDRKQRDTSLIKDMGKTFGLDAVVAVGVFPTEGRHIVTSRIFTADDAKAMDTVIALLSLTSKREALGDVRPFFAPVIVKDQSGKLPDVPVEARFFSIADLDGDGTAEYLFSDEQKLSVYRAEKSGWKELWTERVDRKEQEMQQIRIDVADINKNGRPEIFVTRMLNGRVSSYVVEFENGSYRRIADVPGFLRVIQYPGRGPVLVGQDYDPESFFAGQPREYTWSGTAYAPATPFTLPKGTDLYSFVYADLGEGRPMMVSFDMDRHLVVYSGDTAVWKSEETYQTVETVLSKPMSGLDLAAGFDVNAPNKQTSVTSLNAPLPDKSRFVRINGRMIAMDITGSGKDDLVVAKNTPSAVRGGYKDGELEVLRWTGVRLEPRWSFKDLAGPVFDIQVSRTEASGLQINGLVRIFGGIFGGDKTRIEKFEGK